MPTTITPSEPDQDLIPGAALEADRMPGHWLLARLGKRVLRPGGRELTDRLLAGLSISVDDDVVEVAPGMGATTRLVLALEPASYTGIERDEVAAERVSRLAAAVEGVEGTVVNASATETGLDDRSADVVFGEAYLTMQPDSQKRKILSELARITRPGGRLGLHEIAFAPDDITEVEATRISTEMRSTIKVNVTPLSIAGWTALLEEVGFDVDQQMTAPLHLLEPGRLIADEGYLGAARFVARVARDSSARSRVMAMRSTMRRNAHHLQAVGLTAVRR